MCKCIVNSILHTRVCIFELMKKVLFCMHVCLIVADQHVNVEGYSIADAVPMKGSCDWMLMISQLCSMCRSEFQLSNQDLVTVLQSSVSVQD